MKIKNKPKISIGLKEEKSISNIVIDDLQYEHTSDEDLEVPEYVQGVPPFRVSSRKTAGIGPTVFYAPHSQSEVSYLAVYCSTKM